MGLILNDFVYISLESSIDSDYVQCDIDNPQVDVNQLDDFCSKHNIGGW